MKACSSCSKALAVTLAGCLLFAAGYELARHRAPQVPAAPSIHLNRYEHFSTLMRGSGLRADFSHYRSDFDGSTQTLWQMEPEGPKPEKVFFFFHGMDGDAGDGVVVRDLAEKLNARVIAPGGRGPSWISDAFLTDSAQVIRQNASDFPNFYLIGISMGGTQALALAGLLPEDLRRRLSGVLAIMPAADLNHVVQMSSAESVRKTLADSVGGNQEVLTQRSPLSLISQYPPLLALAIFFQSEDEIFDVASLKDFVGQARAAGHPVSVFSTPGRHEFLYSQFPYPMFFYFLGKNGDVFLREIH